MDKNNSDNSRQTLQSSRNLLWVILAITSGIIIGWIDLQVTEVTVTIFSLLIAGSLFGLLQPKFAWLWALLISAGTPIMEIIAINFSLQAAEPVQLDPFVILIILLFALIGTYAGVFIRKLIRT
ncbi:MAG TPA: hypothetical protein VKA26_14140 [Ignavibacteriaceae bacterium]|nr:hypothetical protein [Ignavibacteriaceae bacterium]